MATDDDDDDDDDGDDDDCNGGIHIRALLYPSVRQR